MIVLGIETSCDETSAALVQNGKILSNVVSSQIQWHAPHGGVVPEIASRQHLKLIDSVLAQCFEKAKQTPSQIDAVAVTRGPGLPSALLVGVATARGFAMRWNKPLLPIHHMEAHLYSAEMISEPFIALIVSGGHTLLIHVPCFGEHRLLGSTVDDAVGEAFDKVAQLLGLQYPGGPPIESHSKKGNPSKYHFPRPMLESSDWNFSFSGLKTAVRRVVQQIPNSQLPEEIPDLCASFQIAVIETLVGKTIKACRTMNIRQISVSGGVACNGALKLAFTQQCEKNGIHLGWAERSLCTDNAAMIALLAERKLAHLSQTPFTWDIAPDWQLG